MQQTDRKEAYFWVLLCLIVAPVMTYWVIFQIQIAINVDIAFLTQSAVRFLDGMHMSEGFYDTNPPLSILVYLLPALLIKYLGADIHYTVFWYDFALVVFSAGIVHQVLKYIPTLSSPQKTLILTIYVLTNTLAVQLYMGEKDQYIVLGLFPFLLTQICLTYGYQVPKIPKFLALFCGALFIMLKPHFYIAPLSVLIHRMVTQKRPTVWKDLDTLYLTTAVFIYALVILILFPDFLGEILPSILALYVNVKETWVLPLSVIAGLVGILFALTAWFLLSKPQQYARLFFVMFVVCLLPFAVQGKGFFYHAIPALVFFCIGLALLLQAFMDEIFGKTGNVQYLSCIITVLLFIAGFWHIFGDARHGMTKEQYKDTFLAQEIMKCEDDCTFFMFNDMTEMIHQLSVHTNQPHASRFPSFWFLPKLLEQNNTTLSEPQKREWIKKFSIMVAQDLDRFDPHILIIGNFRLTDEAYPFNFVQFFSQNSPEFIKIMTEYRLEKSIVVDQKDFFPKTLFPSTPVTYDIYRKISKNPID